MSKTPTNDAAWTAELAATWDAARSELKMTGGAVKAAQKLLEALPVDASDADRVAAQNGLDDAKAKGAAAQETMTSLSKGPKPPKATKPATAPKSNTTPVKSVNGGGSDVAASAAAGTGTTKALESLVIEGELFNAVVLLSNKWDVSPPQALARCIELALSTINKDVPAENNDDVEAELVEAIVVSPVRWKGKTVDVDQPITLPRGVFEQLRADGAVRVEI